MMARALLVSFALATALAAQQRVPLLGTVVDAKKVPIAGAIVQLAHVPPGCEGEVAADHPTATTDERGRFRAEVWPCAQYRAWAIGPARDGRRAVSGVAWTSASDVLELCAAVDVVPCKLLLDGLEPWAHRAPFRVRLLPECTEVPSLAVDLVGGQADLPPLPMAWVLFELVDRDGRVLLDGRYGSREQVRIRVPPPQRVPLAVADEKGAPVAGAEVRLRFDSGTTDGSGLLPEPCRRATWSLLGRTDAAGSFVAEVAARENPLARWEGTPLLFLVSKAGCASTGSGFGSDRVFFDWKVQPSRDVKELRCTLHPARPVRGRVVAGDRPLAGARVTVQLAVRCTERDALWSLQRWSVRTTTDDAGRFAIDDAPIATQHASFAMDVDDAVLVPAAVRGRAPPRSVLLHGSPTRADAECVLDVARCQPLSLRVSGDADVPPKNAEVVFLSHAFLGAMARPVVVDGFTPRAVPESAGRLHVLVEPGTWTVFVRDETRMATAEVDATKPCELVLRLEPMPAMRVHLTDGAGEPLPGQWPRISTWSPGANGSVPLTVLAAAMNRRWIERSATDANGDVLLRFLPVPGSYYEVRFFHDRKRSEPFLVEPRTEPFPVILR